VVILYTNSFNVQRSIFCRSKSVFTVFCILLTTESYLLTELIYLICITAETVCVFTVRYELKLYIVFMLIFICKVLISSV